MVGADDLNPTARQLLDRQQSQRLLDTNSRELSLPVDVDMLVLRHLATCLKEAGTLMPAAAAPNGWRELWLPAMRQSAFGSARTKAALGGEWVADLLRKRTLEQAVAFVNRRCVRAYMRRRLMPLCCLCCYCRAAVSAAAAAVVLLLWLLLVAVALASVWRSM